MRRYAKIYFLLGTVFLTLSSVGCDRIYGLLHKPGGEERKNLGEFVFNEYNAKVEELQKSLKLLGYPVGRPDGKFGAGTREAVVRFQKDEGLEETRFVDRATWERLQKYLNGPFVREGQLDVRNIQLALIKAEYHPGKPDGIMGRATREAIRKFQKDKGLAADGYAGLKTMKAFLPYILPEQPVEKQGK